MKRVPLLGLFFCFNLINISLVNADTRFNSLFHLGEGILQISDKNFYLSENMKLNEEFDFVFNKLKSEDFTEACRFPARFFFVNEKYKITKKPIFKKCDTLNEFIKKVPLERVSLAFASENISVPSSMMGHVFLKLDGIVGNRNVSHSVSFFTDTADGNFPKLAYQSLIPGKKGYYSLTPSKKLIANYIKNEKRNLWSYELDLSNYERKILQYHLYEIKNVKFKYFFHKFNCATLLYNVLRTVESPLLKPARPWFTPLDLVRTIKSANIIKRQEVLLSESWKVKSLVFSENIKTKKIINSFELQEFSKLNLIEKIASKSYNRYMFENSFISEESFLNYDKKINLNKSDTILDLTNYKNPINTISTSAFSFLARSFNESDSSYLLTLNPASHDLEDNNDQYINESKLEIGKVSLELFQSKLRISEFMLYSSKSLMPHDQLIGSYSSEMKFGFIEFDNFLSKTAKFGVVGKIGKTLRLHYDLDSYVLFGAGIIDNNDFVPETEVGLILRSIFDTKFIINLTDQYLSNTDYERLSQFESKLILNFNKYLIVLNYRNSKFKGLNRDELGLKLKLYF